MLQLPLNSASDILKAETWSLPSFVKYRSHKQLTFRADVNKDIASFFGFIDDAEYDNGRNIRWAITNRYPICKKWFQNEKFVGHRLDVVQFVKNKYTRYARTIDTNLAYYERKWRDVEPEFDRLVQEVFGEYPWPEGKYIAYSTIWGIFPRFIENKTFQVPYRYRNKRYVNVIIAHELLHFIFYKYFYEHYPRYRDDKHNFFSWHVSEIFNNVVQNSASWKAVFEFSSLCAPEHEKIVTKLTHIHTGNPRWNLDNLIRDIVTDAKEII